MTAKKCPKCGSTHLIYVTALETITEKNHGVIVFKASTAQESGDLYPMRNCFDCGWFDGAGGDVDLKLMLARVKRQKGVI